MHPSVLKRLPAHGSALISTKGMSKDPREDFPTAIRKAHARLGLSSFERTPFRIRTDPPETARGRGKLEKRKTGDSPAGAIRDFEPLAVLLNACGVPQDRTAAFLNALKAEHPDGKVPMGDLIGRIRTLILSETGGHGQIPLEPESRLAVESGLILWGLSPKQAERVLSLSSAEGGEVDLEKFLKMTAVQGKPASSNAKGGTPKSESGSAEDTRAERAGSRGTSGPEDTPKTRPRASEIGRASAPSSSLDSAGGDPGKEHSSELEGAGDRGTILSFKAEPRRAAPAAGMAGLGDGRTLVTSEPLSRAVEAPAAKKASDGITVQQEKSEKFSSPSVPRKAGTEEQGAAGPGKSKVPQEGEAPRRASSDAASDMGKPSPNAGSHPVTGAGPQLSPARPATAQAQPLYWSEAPIPAHVAAQVGRLISRAALTGDSSLRMHLNPPELGMLRVRLEWSQEALGIEMLADRHQAKDLILASVSELKQALWDQGFRVERLHVAVFDPSGQSMAPSDREQRDPAEPGLRGREGESDGILRSREELENFESPSFVGNRLLDLVA